MSKIEKAVLQWIEKNAGIIFLIGITVAAVFVRLSGMDYQSSDYLGCLLPWYNSLKENGGFEGLGELTGNYNVPYQVLLAWMTYYAVDSNYIIKIFSMVFDLIMAIGAGALVSVMYGKKSLTSQTKEEAALKENDSEEIASEEIASEEIASEEIASEENDLKETDSEETISEETVSSETTPRQIDLDAEIEKTKADIWKAMTSWPFLLAYGGVLMLPTVVMNSSIWAQCDSIYMAFAVLSLCFFYKEKYIPAFILYGISFAFKLQAIFLLPFIIFLYIREKKFSILHFAAIPLVNLIMGLPALLRGLPWDTFWGIYTQQSDEYPDMYLNFPSIWVLLGNDYYTMKSAAIWIAMAVLAAGLFFVIKKKVDLSNASNFMIVAVWTIWATLLLLPSMHERYGGLLEVLLLLLFLVTRERKTFAFATVAEVCGMVVYGKFLFGNYVELNLVSWIYVFSFIFYTIWSINNINPKGKVSGATN